MRVLVVDDEKLARERLSRMVSTLDAYEVVGEAACGDDAVRLAMQLEPDIVLLDIRMPGSDGMQAADQLAKLAYPPAVIFCTAFGEHAIEAFDVKPCPTRYQKWVASTKCRWKHWAVTMMRKSVVAHVPTSVPRHAAASN